MKSPLYALTAAIFAVSIISPVSFCTAGGGRENGDRPRVGKGLQFLPNSSFKIALFADLHYGENAWDDWGAVQDLKSDRVLSIVLDKEIPDFVIYLGDVITANNIATSNASIYWDQAISPTRDRGIPWATLFGNHDDASFEWPLEWFSIAGIPELHCSSNNTFTFRGEKDCRFRGTTRIELLKKEKKKNPLSYSQSGPTEILPAVSNYVLQISSSNDPKSPSVFLYFLDSGGGSYPEVISYAQVKWFLNQAQTINPNSVVPELVFWHIPSQAYKKVAPISNSSIKAPCVGSINLEEVSSQEAEWGMMDVLSKRSSVKASKQS